jgi:cell division protein ZapA (FtsZ GTPase activity inhibitor)
MFEKITTAFEETLRTHQQTANGEMTKEPKNTVYFVDISASTFQWLDQFMIRKFSDEDKNNPRLINGSNFIIHEAIKNYIKEISQNAPPAIETMGAEDSLMAMLTSMGQSTHPYMMVSIGSPRKPPLLQETSNLAATMETFSTQACPPGTNDCQEITYGTSLVNACNGLLSSAYVRRVKEKKENLTPQTFTILTDGMCGDVPAHTENAIAQVLQVFPKAMFKIIAFVLNIKPKEMTEDKLQNLAGLDIFRHLNARFSKNISCFEVNYLIRETDTLQYAIAEPPDTLSLAIGREAGASVSFLGKSVVIPETTAERNKIVLSLIRAITDNHVKDELANIQDADMKDLIDNFTTLGSYMSITLLQNSLASLVTAWIKAKNPDANFTNKMLQTVVKKYLQENVFGPKQEALLNGNTGVALRTQGQRQANFKTILNFWDGLNNPVINSGYFLGKPIVLVDKDDIRKMACIILTEEILERYDNATLLFYNQYIPIICNEGSPDYIRMAVRRIIGRIAIAEGVKIPKVNADKISMMPHMVAATALLSVAARNITQENCLLTETLTGTVTVMLQKEQVDNRSKPPRTLPSAHHMLENDLGLPNEYTNCNMLQKGPAEIFRYACGMSERAPPNVFEDLKGNLLELPPIVDMHIFDNITNGIYYRYKDSDQYVSEETYANILGSRSHMGDTYTASDFTKVDNGGTDSERFAKWMTSPTPGTPITFASLFQ